MTPASQKTRPDGYRSRHRKEKPGRLKKCQGEARHVGGTRLPSIQPRDAVEGGDPAKEVGCPIFSPPRPAQPNDHRAKPIYLMVDPPSQHAQKRVGRAKHFHPLRDEVLLLGLRARPRTHRGGHPRCCESRAEWPPACLPACLPTRRPLGLNGSPERRQRK